MFDEDASAKRTNRMWLKVAGIYERAAYEHAGNKFAPKLGAQMAEIAEACFWQATGQGDFEGMKRLLRGSEPAA